MSDFERKIAKVESTFLGIEDHGIFTCWLNLDYGGAGQGAGQYAFDQYNRETEEREGTAFAAEFIRRVLEACGVDQWEKLSGRTVFALIDNDAKGYGWGGKVVGLAPLPTEGGRDFLFEDLAAKYREEEVPA